MGASVSLAIKIKDYAKLKELDTRVLRWTAFFKPLIGMVFALFTYMAFNSGIVDVSLEGRKGRPSSWPPRLWPGSVSDSLRT
jgi:hypothetical protein